jgi:hypothetical protein
MLHAVFLRPKTVLQYLYGCEVWGFSDNYVIEKKSFEILQINTSLVVKHAKFYDIRRAWSLSTLYRYRTIGANYLLEKLPSCRPYLINFCAWFLL